MRKCLEDVDSKQIVKAVSTKSGEGADLGRRRMMRTDLVLEEHVGHHHPLPVEGGEGRDGAHADDCRLKEGS